ncbi:MAG TPA: hypothetical protein ENG83_07480 [Nitrospirae bacterium]|nr:hypothetical protein [Nitrospirota bacterium]HDZ00841.1 hypothetical protein [Nitrospirota bacterium]
MILLIGTNPLPNFVVAEYFLQNNRQLQKIWLIHSEKNTLQSGTSTQAENLERLLKERWGNHGNLQFPLEKISLTDVSDARAIKNEIKEKMINKMNNFSGFHFNYTGGTKSMSTHVYWMLKEIKNRGERSFSYLDARNYRLVKDDQGVIADDLRINVTISFENLITLHGFERCNKDGETDFMGASKKFQEFINSNTNDNIGDGHFLEVYIAGVLDSKIKNKIKNIEIFQNWKIKKPGWRTDFELDVILLHGYHLTGISCTISADKKTCKMKGFEIIHRTKQIGGDEARAVLVTGSNANQKRILQQELLYDTGGERNILVLGKDDLKTGIFVSEIENFMFGT